MLPAILTAAGLAMSLGPIIKGFFNGDDPEAVDKLREAKQGLAARLSQGSGMPLSQAEQLVNDQLASVTRDHGGEDGWSALSSALGGALLAGGAGAAAGAVGKLGKLAKLGKGAAAVESVAADAAPVASKAASMASAGEDVLTARGAARQDMMQRAQRGEMDSVRGNRDMGTPLLGHDAPREVEAELMDNTPPNAGGSREYTVPTDRFTMRDAQDPRLGYSGGGVEQELQKRAAMAKLMEMISGGH